MSNKAKRMKKLFLPILSIAILFVFVINFSSCVRENNDRFAYDASLDTIPPVISISVPAFNQSYLYGNHVAIVGTVTDLESAKNDIHDPGFRKGELGSVTIDVDDLTHGTKLLTKGLPVVGKDGIGFNERIEIITGSGTTNCRLIIVASDNGEAQQTVRDTVLFTYQ